MLYGSTVQETRQMFYSSWQKYREKRPLSALEQQIVNVINDHAEYHTLLDQKPANIEQNYFPEMGKTNPFLHLGLHLAIRDQLVTNRPFGIISIFQKLLNKYPNPLDVEHLLMENFSEFLWNAQKNHQALDEASYFQSISRLSQL